MDSLESDLGGEGDFNSEVDEFKEKHLRANSEGNPSKKVVPGEHQTTVNGNGKSYYKFLNQNSEKVPIVKISEKLQVAAPNEDHSQKVVQTLPALQDVQVPARGRVFRNHQSKVFDNNPRNPHSERSGAARERAREV